MKAKSKIKDNSGENTTTVNSGNPEDYLRCILIKRPLYTNLYLGFLQLYPA